MPTVPRPERPTLPAEAQAFVEALRTNLETALHHAPGHAGLARTLGILDAVLEHDATLTAATDALARTEMPGE
jgi:hypothetical protein